jgi:hypothetical protein
MYMGLVHLLEHLLVNILLPPIAYVAIIFSIVLGIWYGANGYLIPRAYLAAAFIGGLCLTLYYIILTGDMKWKMALLLGSGITTIAIVSIIGIAIQKKHVNGDDALLSFDIGFAVVLGISTLSAMLTEYNAHTPPKSVFHKWANQT